MATATLLCKQCNFENEPERVYCHNCGAKLDRSLLPPEASRREDPVVMQERVRKLVSPRRGTGTRQIKNFVLSVAIAAVVAAVVVILKPPANLPEISKEAMLSAPTITDDIEALVGRPGQTLHYKEDDVNAFLQYSVRGKETSSYGVSMKFERAFVHFHEGRVSITSEQSIFGLPLYAATVRTVQIENGALVTHPLGGSLGSLRIPGAAMPYCEGVFGPFWKVMDHNRAILAKLQTITFHEKSVDLTSKPAAVR